MDFAVSADKSKNKRKQKDRQILWSCLRAKNAVEHEGDGDTICSWCLWNGLQGLGKEPGGICGLKNRSCLNHSTV